MLPQSSTPSALTAADGRPIIAGFFPDPSICRFNDRYVLVHSSFEYAPAVPVWTSDDLITWAHVGNALDRPSQLRLQPMRHWFDGSEMSPDTGGIPVGSANTGAFAPTVREHEGRLWLAVTNVSDFLAGPLIFSSDGPEGPWSDPVQVAALPGIDPDLFWDEHGVAHLTVSSYANGGPHVMSAPVDLVTGDLLAAARPLWHGTGGQAPESPHLFVRDGWTYLLLAEGGTERGHAVTIARARTLEGPWESAPHNPILTHRGEDRAVLNVGHADLVETRDGRWAMVFLGVRPRGFSGFHVNGRETFLAEVRWRDGWPEVDERGFPVPAPAHAFTEDFAEDALHPRWMSPGRLPAAFVSPRNPGIAISAREDAHALLATRPRDEYWCAEATLRVQGSAGLCVRVDEFHSAEVLVEEGRLVSVVRVGDLIRRVEGPGVEGDARLVIRVLPDDAAPLRRGPDRIELGAVVDGETLLLDAVDGRYLSVEVAGGWTGRVVGMRALRGTAEVSVFSYAPETIR